MSYSIQIRGPIMVTMKSQDSRDTYFMDEEKQKLINLKETLKRRHSDSTVLLKDHQHQEQNSIHNQPPDLTALQEIENDFTPYSSYDRRDSNYSTVSHFSHISTGTEKEEDGVDKLLRRVSGCSYNKYRNGAGAGAGAGSSNVSSPKLVQIDSGTRDKLKIEIVKHIDQLRLEYEARYKEEKDILMLKYKKECKQWEDKYKALKKENKRRKLKSIQRKQKTEEKPVGGCKFWSLGSWTNAVSHSSGKGSVSFCNPQNMGKSDKSGNGKRKSEDLSIAEVNKILTAKKRKKKVRFAVPDDSDDTVNSSKE